MGFILNIGYQQIDKNLDATFYALELAIMAVMVTNMFQFGWWRCKARRGDLTHWQRWDAAYYLAITIPLSLAMPFAVILIYIGHVNYPDSKMWRNGSWAPNTPHGILLYLAKWTGVATMLVGVLKATQLHRRIAAKWRALRKATGARGDSGPDATTAPQEVVVSEVGP